MAEMATTGITEPAAGNIPGSAIHIEALQETLRHPSETQGLIPLDRYIRNYDSAYHIIFTNVKTNSQIPLQTAVNRPPPATVRISGMCWQRRDVNGGADTESPASHSETV